MSSSFDEERSAKKDPASDEKVFDRFAGNIAESDDDYDEEDMDHPSRKPSSRISDNFDPKPEVGKSSFFSPAPVIVSKEIV